MNNLSCDWSKRQVISAVGGGGKTSFVHTLAKELHKSGKRVILTTTTHMEWPTDTSCVAGEIQEIAKHLDNDHFVIAGVHPGGHRMSGVSKEVFDKMKSLCDVIVIEADGAKRLPLKAPDISHEPVIPDCTTLTAVIGGLNAIGKPIVKTCFRLPQVQAILKKDLEDVVCPQDLGKLLVEGYTQVISEQAPQSKQLFVVNQADDAQHLEWAEQIADMYSQRDFLASCFLQNS